MRWRIALMVCAGIAISYLDRQTLPVAVKAIARDIPLSNEQFSTVQSAFLFAYALMYVGGGKLADALGTRRGFAIIMLFWSAACAGHALAVGIVSLGFARFLLGVGEGGGFPAATRVVAEWFRTEERATAMGIINAGTAVGAVAAPPLIAVILGFASWRWIFLVTGLIGMLWTAWWWHSYFAPSKPAEVPDTRSRAETAIAWPDLLRMREIWGLVTAKFLSDAAWYFYLFWLPKYLYDARGFDIKGVGALAWMPNAAAGVGCLVGGWFSSRLVGRNFSLNAARKIALGLSAAVMPFIVLVPSVGIGWAISLFCLAYFGQQSWSTLVMVLPADLFATEVVGSVAGLVGFGGAMGGIVFGQIAGYLLDHGFGYRTVFRLAGTFHVAGFLVILAAVPVVGRLARDRALGYGGSR